MATRRRRSTTARGTSTRRRTSSRSRTSTSRRRRRRPTLATTVGSAFALAIIYAWKMLTWPWLVGIIAVGVTLMGVWFLWSRRGDIYDEYQVRRAEEENPR